MDVITYLCSSLFSNISMVYTTFITDHTIYLEFFLLIRINPYPSMDK